VTESQPSSRHPQWRQLLGLAEQLMAQPGVAAQRELIMATAAGLTGGQADLWLAPPLQWLPDLADHPHPAEPPTELMRQASATLSMARQDEAIALPLRAHDTLLGVLEVQRTAGPPFDDDLIALLDGLAVQAAVALHATRQIALDRWRIQQLSLVRKVSAQVASITDLDELCSQVTELISRTFGYYSVTLFTLEPGQEMLRFRANAGSVHHRSGSPASDLTVRLGEGIIGHVAQAGQEIAAGDVTREPRYRHSDLLPETRSEVALPLKIEDRVLGVLDVQSTRPDDFDETDMLVLRALADTIAVAMEGVRLYEALRRRADQMAAVAEVSRAVASILDLDTLLGQVATLIYKHFGYPFVYLYTVDPARRKVVYRAGSSVRTEQMEEQAYGLDDPNGIVPWVAREGRPLIANDVRQEPHYRPSALPPDETCAEMAVPLIFGGEVLGVLDVQSDRCDAFGEDARFVFSTLADNLAIAVRNANLYRSERWRRQVAESLREVAGLLSADLDLDQVLDAILTELERILPYDVAAIWLLEDGNLCLSAVHGFPAELCVPDRSADSNAWLSQALRADQATVRTPDSPFEPLGAALNYPPDYSAVAAPLRVGERRLGLLTLAHHEAGRYGTESRAMTTAFASYAAVAIENTRLYESAQEQAWISTVMLQAAEATQSLTTLEQVLETVVRMVPMLVGVERCALLLWDEAEEAFLPAAAHGLDAAQREAFNRWRVEPEQVLAFDQLRLSKAPLTIHDASSDPRLSGVNLSAFGFGAVLFLPLLAHGEVVGVLLADDPPRRSPSGVVGALSDERLAILQGIAHQAAATVESTRLREAQQEETYVSAVLLQVAQAVVSLNDLDEILAAIVRITPLLVGVEQCAVFLWEEDYGHFRPSHVYGLVREAEEGLLTQRYAPGDFPLLDAVRAEARLITYPQEAPPHPDGWLPADFPILPEGNQTLLAVPLAVKGEVLGVLLVTSEETSRRARDRRLEIITGIADQAALAVQNTRLQEERAGRERLERELQLAHDIQQTFLPNELPELPGWELAATWRAARQVAGDYYDIFALPEGRLGLVIADVADKGMPAALFMVLTRTLVRAAALEVASPAEVLRRVNDLLVPDSQHGMFVTAFYAVLSPQDGTLTCSNAGHNRPFLWCQRTGELTTLEKGGMALGVLEGITLPEQTAHLEPGDCLVLYTDGVTEALSPEGEFYGEERLQAMIRSLAGQPAQALLQALDDAVVSFVGDSFPSDDLTLLVLRRTPSD